jgi:hypothetical protein
MFPSYDNGGKIDFVALEARWRKHWPLAIELARFWDASRPTGRGVIAVRGA